MPASNPPKKKSGVCPKCKQKFSFEIKPGMASVECSHCQAKIKLKPKANKKSRQDEPPSSKSATQAVPKPGTSSARPSRSSSATRSTTSDKKKPIDNQVDVPSLPTAKPATLGLDQIKIQPSNQDETLQGETPVDSLPVTSPASINSLPTPKPATDSEAEPENPPAEAIATLVPKVDLLPPKFIVDQTVANVVILPSADGGTQVIDPNVVHVKHGNQTISLTTLTPIQKARRQAIQNFVILLLAGLMLVAAIWILL